MKKRCTTWHPSIWTDRLHSESGSSENMTMFIRYGTGRYGPYGTVSLTLQVSSVSEVSPGSPS
jgi:hypothetical protein